MNHKELSDSCPFVLTDISRKEKQSVRFDIFRVLNTWIVITCSLVDKHYGLMGCVNVQFGRQVLTLQKNLLPPSPTLKTEATGTSKTLVHIYQATWQHIPQDFNLNIHHHENLICHSLMKGNKCFEGTTCLHLQGTLN